jgi:hypothetical protein
MTDQKNKQSQQPQQGNKQNSNQSEQGHKPSGSHSKSSGNAKTAMPDSDEDPVREADFGDDQPGKKIQIDDNPEETKKKIPNGQKKH